MEKEWKPYMFQADGTMKHEFDTAEEAIAFVEAKPSGQGSVVKFINERNYHGGWDWKSLSLWSYQNGEWWSHYIHSGSGEKLKKEKPH